MFRRAAFMLVALVVAGSALAVSPQRTFVASYGSDTNPCSLPAPCRGFQAAIDAVAPGGEVIALDSAGYGPFDIHKSVSVIAPPGVYAGVYAPDSYGAKVFPTGGGGALLRGLTFKGNGGLTGIYIGGPDAVRIDECAISDFGEGIEIVGPSARISKTAIRNSVGWGIDIVGSPNVVLSDIEVSSSGADGVRIRDGTTVHIENARIHSNAFRGIAQYDQPVSTEIRASLITNNAQGGIYVTTGAISLDNVGVENNQSHGVNVYTFTGTPVNLLVQQSQVSGNSGIGVSVTGPNASTATIDGAIIWRNGASGLALDTGTMSITRSTVSENYGSGVIAGGASTFVSITGSTFTHNASAGIQQINSATVRSLGNNTVIDNLIAETAGTIITVPRI